MNRNLRSHAQIRPPERFRGSINANSSVEQFIHREKSGNNPLPSNEENIYRELFQRRDNGGAYRIPEERMGGFPNINEKITEIKWIRHPDLPENTTIRDVLILFQQAGHDYKKFYNLLLRYFRNPRSNVRVPYRISRPRLEYDIRKINDPMVRAFARYIDHFTANTTFGSQYPHYLERLFKRMYNQRTTLDQYNASNPSRFRNPLVGLQL